ncbi:hypothetical protein [Nocardiopsis sp. MG754419]|uniref:hypothetical protein n=1 Tax=Nocardiopsis sp. MG754419 TaxID=2259865 RepID=UPI0027DD5517|nr:hypothetical protein [Nocardiopsis sp. MG754419]
MPVRPAEEFGDDHPDHTLLFAWNHAEEITDKEGAHRAAGGKWIVYVFDVRVV